MFQEGRSPQEIEPQGEVESKVVIEFSRHGKRENDPNKANKEQMLRKDARPAAKARGLELKPQPEVSIAFGSQRRRTQDTAARIMLSGREEITDEMSLDEIEASIEKELKSNNLKKIVEDNRLDFKEQEGSPYLYIVENAYKEGKLLSFIVHESDKKAKEMGDTGSYTYSRNASQVAQIIEKYLNIGNNFQKVVAKNPDKFKAFGNQLERYMGTHQSVQESFVAKYLEKVEGVDARDAYVKEIGEGGIAELQGIRVEIANKGESQQAMLYAKTANNEWTLVLDKFILDEIIAEGMK